MTNFYKPPSKKFRENNYPFWCTADSCKIKIIMLLTKNGKKIPVDYDSLTTEDKYEMLHGAKIIYRKNEHMTHFATCTEPNRFRKNK